ncbi:MAG: hypothetical protein AB8B50_13245 [Pirellulaceae bacterium]
MESLDRLLELLISEDWVPHSSNEVTSHMEVGGPTKKAVLL